jgi:hypothetical protein
MSKKLDCQFENWLRKTGVYRVATLLKIKPMTVYYWLSGTNLPTAAKMKEIKKLTKGKIGYTQIIEGSCSPLTK